MDILAQEDFLVTISTSKEILNCPTSEESPMRIGNGFNLPPEKSAKNSHQELHQAFMMHVTGFCYRFLRGELEERKVSIAAC